MKLSTESSMQAKIYNALKISVHVTSFKPMVFEFYLINTSIFLHFHILFVSCSFYFFFFFYFFFYFIFFCYLSLLFLFFQIPKYCLLKCLVCPRIFNFLTGSVYVSDGSNLQLKQSLYCYNFSFIVMHQNNQVLLKVYNNLRVKVLDGALVDFT